MHIGKLGDHIADDTGVQAHLLDLVFQRHKLHALAGCGQIRQRRKDLVEMVEPEALIDTMWVDLAPAALPAGLEPPGVVSAVAGAQRSHVGQAPVAELRDD